MRRQHAAPIAPASFDSADSQGAAGRCPGDRLRPVRCRRSARRAGKAGHDRMQHHAHFRRRQSQLWKCGTYSSSHDRRAGAVPGISWMAGAQHARTARACRHPRTHRDRCEAARRLRPHARLRLSRRRPNDQRRDGALRVRDGSRVSAERQIRRTDSACGSRCAEGEARIVGDRFLRLLAARLPGREMRWSEAARHTRTAASVNGKKLTQSLPLHISAAQHRHCSS